MRRLLPPQRAKTARRGARLAAIGLLAALIVSAFALARKPIDAQAASNPANLAFNPPRALDGCRIGPTSFTFCDQVPGTQGPYQIFFVVAKAAVTGVSFTVGPIPGLSANFAAGDFIVTSTPPPNVSTNAGPCAGNVGADQACAIFVAFSPTTTGLRQTQILVTDSQGDSLPINIEGTGTQLALVLPLGGFSSSQLLCSPPPQPPTENAFTFCPAAIGTTSATENFTLSSGTGAAGINVTLAATPGLESEFAAGDFTIESTTCTGALPPSGNCTIGVAFTPTAAGLRSATLTATDPSGDTSTIYLAGATTSGVQFSGVALPFSAQCEVVSIFHFCNMPVGGVSDVRTFKFENTSGTQVTGLTIPTGSVFAQGATAPDFTVQNTSCTSVLAAGATCNVTVAFTPTKSGLRQGAIVITDAQGDVATANLAGVGDDYNIVTQLPTEVSAIPGATATFNATLTPDGVFGMNGEQVTFVCPEDLPANTSCVVTPCPATITPGAPVSVKVTLVTSSALIVAPMPPPGCSSYGPSLAAIVRAPGGDSPVPPAAGTDASRASPLYPALLIFAAFGALGLLVAIFALPGTSASRKRMPLVFACAGLAAAILTGCHHHSATATTATPTGATTMTVLGDAVDASGNSLNTSRQFQVTLDVVSQ